MQHCPPHTRVQEGRSPVVSQNAGDGGSTCNPPLKTESQNCCFLPNVCTSVARPHVGTTSDATAAYQLGPGMSPAARRPSLTHPPLGPPQARASGGRVLRAAPLASPSRFLSPAVVTHCTRTDAHGSQSQAAAPDTLELAAAGPFPEDGFPSTASAERRRGALGRRTADGGHALRGHTCTILLEPWASRSSTAPMTSSTSEGRGGPGRQAVGSQRAGGGGVGGRGSLSLSQRR